MAKQAGIINVAVIGAGGRSRGVVRNLLRDSNRNVRIASVYDPDRDMMEKAAEYWQSPDMRRCEGYREAVDTANVDWVMVFSPNAYHKEHILYGFEQGKHVFSEKPLATTIDDCREIYAAHQAAGLLFVTGFVLRYAPLYRKAKEILDSGRLGRILSIGANENIDPGHGGYIMRNWRRYRDEAGPHILEKCCHDLDLINWFCGSVPTKVAAFASNDFFVSANECLNDKYGPQVFACWDDPHAKESPFTVDKDIDDTHVGILQYRNGIKVMFQATMSNAIPERRMYFSCTEGTMIGELYTGTLRYKAINDEGVTLVDVPGGGHGGGDDYIMKELYDTMVNGTEPKSSGDEGLESAVTALALDRAAHEGTVLDLEPVWAELGRENSGE